MGNLVVMYQLAQVLGTLGSFQWQCQYVFKAGDTIELEKAKMPN